MRTYKQVQFKLLDYFS